MFQCGIVGLPNVGKSTLFNALTSTSAAQAANYPFCTIEPNVGRVALEDERLDVLANIAKSQKIIYVPFEFVDIAGLVKGASQGQGLGNQFLSHIRQTDAIIHMVRCFDDDDIIHVEGGVDPLRDVDIIETELLLADLASVEKKMVTLEKKARHDKDAQKEHDALKPVLQLLSEGKRPIAYYESCDSEKKKIIDGMQLISTKKILYVANVHEDDILSGNEFTKKLEQYALSQNAKIAIICAKMEEEMGELPTHEKKSFLKEMGLNETGLNRIAHMCYSLLGLMSFFTIGPKEAHGWTIKRGAKAPQAAGEIHTDFERGFICAQTISYDDYVTYKGEEGAKENGKMRLEGKEYVVQDGDVMHFRFNV